MLGFNYQVKELHPHHDCVEYNEKEISPWPFNNKEKGLLLLLLLPPISCLHFYFLTRTFYIPFN